MTLSLTHDIHPPVLSKSYSVHKNLTWPGIQHLSAKNAIARSAQKKDPERNLSLPEPLSVSPVFNHVVSTPMQEA